MRRVFLWLCGTLLLTLPTCAQGDAWQAAMDAGRAAASDEARITAYAKAVELAADFAADDDRVHACSLALAQVYDRNSRPDDANQVISSLLARRIRALGLADPKLATTYLAIGDYYLSFGNFDVAKPQFDRALAICTKAYGEGDPRLAPCYTGLSEYYRRKNDPRGAVAALQTAIALIEQGGGKESPDLAKPLMRLASLYQNLRTLPEAKAGLTSSEAGITPPWLLNISSGAGITPLWLLALPEAEAALTRALAVLEKAYGPEDAQLVEALQAMGAYYWYAVRKPEQGLPYYQRALAIQEQALKADDPQFAASLQSLAALSNTLRRFDDAVQYYRRLLAAQEAKEPGGRNALYARVGLATALIRAKQPTEAREEIDRLFTAAAKLTDRDGYYTRNDFHRQIAQAYHQAGAYAEADAAYGAWAECVEKTPAPGRGGVRMDPLVAILTNWAGFYRQFGRETEAETLLQRMADRYAARGTVPDTALVALAECLVSQGKITEAEAQLTRSTSGPGAGYRPIAWAEALLPLYRGMDLLNAAAPLPRIGRSLS
ncbi:MAG TPA: tetratricopeptide repeat protein, partial [Armatimonadota bacterium]|nr:tetratricopeptide repeat protein [Armatimonadota bacterium]